MGAFKDRITRRILEICLGFRLEIETEVRASRAQKKLYSCV
jgi:hypothetical protein